MCLRTLVLAATAGGVTTSTKIHSSPLLSSLGHALDHRAGDESDWKLIPSVWRLRHEAVSTKIRYGLMRLEYLYPFSRIVQ